MHVLRLDHATIKTERIDESVAFYHRFLDLSPGFRPDFGFPGAWLYPKGGDYALLHIIGRESRDCPNPVFDHVAFRGVDILAFLGKLRSEAVPFKSERVPGTPYTQVHFYDPNGVKIEMLFEEVVDSALLASPDVCA